MDGRVAICGVGLSLSEAPFDSDIEIWGLNHHYKSFPRWDLWFDVHHAREMDKHITQANYPLEEALKLRGRTFRSSISYMIAYAILAGYTRIELYGVDFNSQAELRTGQKQCCLEWIAYAKGRGIDVYIADSSSLNQNHKLYGYE